MKMSRRSSIACCRWLMVACLALLAPSFVSGQAIERPLTDKDIERWLPRLRAEAAAFSKQVSEAREVTAAFVSASEEYQALLADMASGKTDISTWMRSRTKYALVPPGAVYCDKCSQALIYETGGPIAVFTFNRESQHRDLLRRAASGDEAARDEYNTRRGEEEARKRTAEEQAVQDFVAGIKTFYFDHGFTEVEVIGRSVTVWFLQSPDERVPVTIWEVNPYCGLLPRNIISPCAELPTGPMIEIQYHREPVEVPGSATEEQAAAEGQRHGEKKPSSSEKEDADYERVRNALLMACTDAANPEALEFEIPPDLPAEAKAGLAPYAAELAKRKANVLMYKRHEAELAPLLKALLQLSE